MGEEVLIELKEKVEKELSETLPIRKIVQTKICIVFHTTIYEKEIEIWVGYDYIGNQFSIFGVSGGLDGEEIKEKDRKKDQIKNILISVLEKQPGYKLGILVGKTYIVG